MSDAVFNTKEIQDGVNAIEKSFDHLTREIEKLNSQKINSIQRELAKLGSSAKTSVQEMAASMKSGLDSMLQAQIAHGKSTTDVQRAATRIKLDNAKDAFLALAMTERDAYRASLTEQKATSAQKIAQAQAESSAILAAKKVTDSALMASSAQVNAAEVKRLMLSENNVKKNIKYVVDLETARQEIEAKGTSATLRNLNKREASITHLLQKNADTALALAEKIYGTDFVAVVKAGLGSESKALADHTETMWALRQALISQQVKANKILLSEQQSAEAASLQARARYAEVYKKIGDNSAPNTGLRLLSSSLHQDSALVLAEMNAFYTKLTADSAKLDHLLQKLGNNSGADTGLRMLSSSLHQDSGLILAEMTAFYAKLSADSLVLDNILKKLGTNAGADTGLRLLSSSLHNDSALILSEMAAFYTKLEADGAILNRILQKLGTNSGADTGLRLLSSVLHQDSSLILAEMSVFYARLEADSIRLERLLKNLGANTGADTGLRLLNSSLHQDSALVLSEMSAFYTKLEVDSARLDRLLAKLGTNNGAYTGLRLLSSNLHQDSALVLAEMRTLYTELERLSKLKDSINGRLATGNVGASLATNKVTTLDQKDGQYNEAMSAMKAFYGAQAAEGLSYKPSAASMNTLVSAMVNSNKASETFHANTAKSSSLLNAFTLDSKDAHAAVRGLSQGFGSSVALYGSILPLLAGTAVASIFVKSLKQGAEFAEKLFVIGELAGASTAEVEKLAQASLRLGATTQYGPLEVAEALKVLSLAGLNAEKALSALKPTLDFAAAGGVTTEAAAATLVAVATAYQYAAESFSTVGDIIAKTAADTQASVADMSEAFKSSSVLAQQYGVTLEETAQALGMLAQIGIKGSAAGTSWRNMLTEFNKGSGKAAEGIRELGIELKNIDGTGKPIMEVMETMTKGLVKKTSTAQDRILQDITNERGAKATAAFQSQVLATLHKTNPLLQEQADYYFKIGDKIAGNKLLIDATSAAYEKMNAKAAASREATPNFSFFANLEGQFTPLKLMSGLSASMSVSLTNAFKSSEGAIVSFGMALREVLNSEGFKSAISNIVGGVTTTITLFKDGAIIVAESVAWAYDHMLMAVALAIGGFAAALAIAMVATQAFAAVMATYASAVVVATLAVNALNAAFATAGIGLGLTLGGFVLITAAVVATVLVVGQLIWNYNKAAETAEESAERQLKAKAKIAAESVGGAEAIMNSQRNQLAERIASSTAELAVYNSNATIQKAVNAELALSFEARKKGNTKAEKEHAALADDLRATMVGREEAAVQAQGAAMKVRINQWAEFRLTLSEVGEDAIWADKLITGIGTGLNAGHILDESNFRKGMRKAAIYSERDSRLVAADNQTEQLAKLTRVSVANQAADAKAANKKLTGTDGTGGYVGKNPKDSKVPKVTDDDDKERVERDLAKVANKYDALSDSVKMTDKIFEATRAAGYVDDKSYYESKIRLVNELGTLEAAKLREQIAVREKATFTGKKATSESMANTAAKIKLETLLGKTISETAINAEVLGIQADNAMQKVLRGYVDAQKAAENFLDTLKRTSAREMQGFTMGDRKFAQVNAEGSITDKAQAEFDKLNILKESLKGQRGSDGQNKFTGEAELDYNTKLAAAVKAQQDELAISRDTYDKKTAMRANYDAGAKKALENYMEQTQDVYGQVNSIVGKSLSGIEDNLTTMLTTGKTDFKSFAASILSDITRMIVKQMIFNQLVAAKNSSEDNIFGTALRFIGSAALGVPSVPNLGSTPMQTTPDYPTMGGDLSGVIPSAKGNVFTSAGLSAYSGQIVSSPTTFAFAKGAGLMGEAGPEAIMPLARGANGKLGVQVSGGGGNGSGGDINVSVTVDATGSKAAGDDKRANQLGDMIGGAVRNILVQEKRPGGILA